MMYHTSDQALKPYKSVEVRTMYLIPRPDLNNATLSYGDRRIGEGTENGGWRSIPPGKPSWPLGVPVKAGG